ncbi:MAG: WhiB family transcriptional regulator [Pseudonocardia sp.]
MHQPTDTHWREEALCAQTDPEIFFPEVGENPKAARQVCAACPVRTACLTDALRRRDIAFGVRGGLTPTERRALLRPTSVRTVRDGRAA